MTMKKVIEIDGVKYEPVHDERDSVGFRCDICEYDDCPLDPDTEPICRRKDIRCNFLLEVREN